VSAAETAARRTFIPGSLSGRHITAATITETKVIIMFTGRVIFKIAFSFSINFNQMLLRD